jgi:hypothetical protein
MAAEDKKELEVAYAKLRKRKPWANEDMYSGGKRVFRDVLYTAASSGVPNFAGRAFQLKKKRLYIATAAGTAMLNVAIHKMGELFKTFDLTRNSATDLIDGVRYATVGNKRMEYDNEREYNAADYFAKRDRLDQQNNLPHHWEFTFEQLEEHPIGFTDKAVASLFGLYVLWEAVVGGPVSADRMKHWWKFETNNDERGLRHQMGFAYRRQEMLNDGESLADVQRLYDQQFGNEHAPSHYIPDHNFNAGNEEDFAPGNHAVIYAVQEAAAAAAVIAAAGDG